MTDFADSVSYSLAEAWLYYPDMKPFAISKGGDFIGFVMLYVGEENYQIINFFIIEDFRDKGYGNEAARLCIDYLKDTYKADKISIPVDCRNLKALEFWQKLGFVESENSEDGYLFMRYYLYILNFYLIFIISLFTFSG